MQVTEQTTGKLLAKIKKNGTQAIIFLLLLI